MKKMKKMFVVLLSLALVFTSVSVAFASDGESQLKSEWKKDQDFTLADPAPWNLDELKQVVDVQDPRSVAAYFVWSVNRLVDNYDDGMAMMKYLFADLEPYGTGYTEGGMSGKAGWDTYFNERLKSTNYKWLPRAYFNGASKSNKFVPTRPLTLELYYNAPNTKAINEQALDQYGRLTITYWIQSYAGDHQININVTKFKNSDRWYVTSGATSAELFYDQSGAVGSDVSAAAGAAQGDTSTAAQHKAKYGKIETVNSVALENFTVPSNGQVYGDSGVKLAAGFPGTIDKATWLMFKKSMDGEKASTGETVQFAVYVKLDDGYVWGSAPTATLNGTTYEERIKPSDDVRAFAWTFTIKDTDKIKITDQSPATLEYTAGSNVKLFVKATGAENYQWCKFGQRSGGAKQQYAAQPIAGATGAEYTIPNADASLDGAQYQCKLSSADGEINSRTITLKLVDEIVEKPNPFVDVKESDPFYDAVQWAYYADPQVTTGTDATHYSPQNTVKRCECVTFLWRALGKPKPSSSVNPFKDVKSDDYFYEPVLWAVENGITNGTTATTFDPNATLSTQHMVTFLYRAMKIGPDGWNGEAAAWAGSAFGGKPFGVNISVNNQTPCPRGVVAQFLYVGTD